MLIAYLRYFFGALITIPLLPILYVQGKRVKANIPSLPEAKGVTGIAEVQGTQDTLKVLTVGESTMAGVGVDTHEEGFSGNLARELSRLLGIDIDWKVYARSGYTAQKVRERLLPAIQETHPDLIVIGLGGNDSFTLNTPWGWKKEIQLLIEAIKEKFPEAKITFISMPPIKAFAAFTSIMKWVIGNLCEIHGEILRYTVDDHPGVAYYHQVITLEKWMKQFDIDAKYEDFFSDGVHPSKLTYQVMARDMALFIEKQLT